MLVFRNISDIYTTREDLKNAQLMYEDVGNDHFRQISFKALDDKGRYIITFSYVNIDGKFVFTSCDKESVPEP